MNKFIGKGVYSAVAIGKISVIRKSTTEASRLKADDKSTERIRLENAKKEAAAQLRDIYKKALNEAGKETAEIFDIHLMMIEDEDYNDAILGMLDEGYTAEYAVEKTGRAFAKSFADMDDEYMKARAADIKDISDRILSCLTGNKEENAHSGNNLIICAEDLSPSETIALDKSKVVAFVTAYGSQSSHTAILAKSMGIPAIIGVGKAFLDFVRNGDTAIVDGGTGEFITAPDDEAILAARKRQDEEKKFKAVIEENRGKENITLDGRKIEVFANAGSLKDVKSALANDAGGIGLFRSEFIYLDKNDYPTEEEQFEIYKTVLTEMKGKKVIIRTLDIGADKSAEYFELEKEENPALGLRAIRLCLSRPEIFRTQLRALLRASHYGKLGIMFPMISSVSELTKAQEILSAVKSELNEQKIPYDENAEVGIMIETPAAAVLSDILAKHCDFFSIGTNDLAQYTTACDRQNPYLDKFSDTEHTALLRLIRYTVKSAHENGIWVGICGELAADTSFTEEFLRMGIDELSVTPSFVLTVRDKIRKTDLKG